MSMIRARLTLNKRLNATLICQPYKRLLHSSRAIAHQHKDQEQIPDHEHNHDPTIEEHGLKSMLSHSHSHGHSHSHSGENAFLTLSKDKVLTNPGVRITWIGLGSNVLMAVGKFFGGIAFHSQALLADSVHAMSDLVSDFLTLFSVSLSSKKSNDMYPYGYGKVETVGSLAVSTILAGAGVSIGWSSLCAIVGPIVPHTIIESLHNIFGSMIDFSGSHSHSHTSATDVNAAWIAGGSIIMKEWIFQATKRVAIKTNSNVLMANHSGENAFLTLSKDKVLTNPGVRITWIGLGSNVLMAVGKFFGGIAFHSQALLADSVHAMSDLVSDFLTLFSVSLSSKKSNDMYPYGYGKVETVGSLAVSTILAGAGVSIGWSSLCAIVGPIVPHTIIESLHNIFGSMIDFSGSHSHSHTSATDVNAAWIAGGSIIMKEWIFQATKRVAIKTNSNVLMANAWHHRIDSLTSLVALVAISSSYFFGIQSLDSLGGLLVSVLIIKAGGEGMVSSVKELTDQSLSKKDERYLEIESILKKQIPLLDRGNLELDRLVVMPSGPKMRAITTLSVPQDSNISVHDMDNVTAELRKSMLDGVKNLSFFDVRYTSKY